MSTSILHLFFFTCFLLSKMHYLDHILECPIGPSLKVVQLRRLFDWTNMAAALPQFFGPARHPCFEVSASNLPGGLNIQYHASSIVIQTHHQLVLKTCGATRNPEFPRTGPKPVRCRGTVLRIFSGRVGSGNFISGRSGSGYFLPGYETFSPGISGINLPFIPKLKK